MSKKSSRGQDHPRASTQEGSGEKESTKRHVYIEPGAKIDFVEDLRKQQKAQQDENTVQQRKQLFWTKVAAALILLYTIFSGWQVKLARDTFIATNRPYIGVSGVPIWTPEAGTPDKPLKEFVFHADIKNFGTVPGTNFVFAWKVFLGGIEQTNSAKIPDQPSTLFPGQSVYLRAEFGHDEFPAIASGEKTLVFETSYRYDGPSDTYVGCQKYHYSARSNAFFNLGNCKPDI